MASGSAGQLGRVPGTGTRMAEVSAVSKPVKQTRFAAMAEWFEIEGDEFDEFTFENCWEDGSRKASLPSKQRIGPPPRRVSSVAASIWAHRRAMAWVMGGICHDLPEARTISHDGRVPVYSVDPDDVDDFEFVMDQDALNQNYPITPRRT